ncbi:hypothetical protein HaLaN_05413 [Haematococcus lacustris]|uniref:Uncharacterized protein n=1 Tax=Haematococcus lacustris TaxID=44745 RepID=A0A699YQW6_HAELA|nr:hypothetical protein HaLaN_05413 [Haematococcus lacustris]
MGMLAMHACRAAMHVMQPCRPCSHASHAGHAAMQAMQPCRPCSHAGHAAMQAMQPCMHGTGQCPLPDAVCSRGTSTLGPMSCGSCWTASTTNCQPPTHKRWLECCGPQPNWGVTLPLSCRKAWSAACSEGEGESPGSTALVGGREGTRRDKRSKGPMEEQELKLPLINLIQLK